MDALALLKEDHAKAKKLMEELAATTERGVKTREEKWTKLLKELTIHENIEEEIFYPAAREAVPETKDHVLESVEEHHVVVWMLSELVGMDPKDETFDAKVTVLTENVRHHVEEEEDEWFPEVRSAMGRKRLQELGQRMIDARGDAPKNPLELKSAKA